MNYKENTRSQASTQKHPKDEATYLSQFLFLWQLVFVIKKYRTKLEDNITFAPLKNHDSKSLGDKLQRVWEKEIDSCKNPSFTRVLMKTFGIELLTYGILYSIVDITVTIFQPIAVMKLMDHYTSPTASSKNQPYFYGSLIVICLLLGSLTYHFFLLHLSNFELKVRTACCSLIYRTTLKLKQTDIQKITVGRIINLLSNDVERFHNAFSFLHFLWILPVKFIVTACYICVEIDFGATAGEAVFIAILLVYWYLFKKMSVSRKCTALQTDYRIGLMNNILCSIQAIKMYAWENYVSKYVKSVRSLEVEEISRTNLYRITIYAILSYLQGLSLLLCILVTVLRGLPIKPQHVFVLVTIYELLKFSTQLNGYVVIVFSDAKVSIQRIQEFLLVESKQRKNFTDTFRQRKSLSNAVVATNIFVRWNPSLPINSLTNVTISCTSCETIAITGPPGGGKSTFLQAMLKEIDIMKGVLHVEGSQSYAPQEPWIFSATIKQNILFGEKMNNEKYLEVIRVCALEYDLSILSHGDNTLVGERGVMLSGGQKARVSLARAIYRDSDIYLLDDPLSAIDNNVADHIFHECILGYLKNKCVVVVTHQSQYLPHFDQIHILNNGEKVASGNYEELAYLIGKAVKGKNKTVETKNLKSLGTYTSASEVEETCGKTSVSSYRRYCLSRGQWVTTCLILLLFTFFFTLMKGNDYFLSFWASLTQESAGVPTLFTDMQGLYIYGAALFVIIFLNHISAWLFVQQCKRTSKHLHDELLDKTLLSSMYFFNNHSSGRILNRFSTDIGIVDEVIPYYLFEIVKNSFVIIATTALVLILNYWMFIPTVLMSLIFYCYCALFQNTITYFRDTAGTRRSTILTHLSTSIQGLNVIRASKVQKLVQVEFDNHQDLYNSVSYLHKAFYYASAFWTDVTYCFYTAVIIFSVIIYNEANNVGNFGLVITQSIMLAGAWHSEMKLLGYLNSKMSSVERIAEYVDLAPEADEGTSIPSEAWPDQGNITFHSVSMRYSPDKPFVLQDLSFAIQASEKIGIVGRTGAGKSSLILALFRLFDFDGSVYIDGVDTKSVPLNTLRSRISIIPQEPVLFLRTIRENLDPFDEFSDFQIWNALESVRLKETISNLPLCLDYEITECGSNFSVGERQLLSLVRTILKKSKIIVLDEATASVDLQTDELVQSIIRTKFLDSTVLTIAHRLNTVMDSDKILVIDSGKAVEFDKPEILLRNSDGYFTKYCSFYNDQSV